mgnify:CR=1 FL=1
MSAEETILYAVLTPLVGAGLIAVTGSRPNLREAVTLASGVVLFVLVADLYPLVAAGRTPSVDMMEMLPGLAISFTVEPLGMIFAGIASFLWIVTSIYSIGYMRGHDEANQTRFYAYFAIALGAYTGLFIAIQQGVLTPVLVFPRELMPMIGASNFVVFLFASWVLLLAADASHLWLVKQLRASTQEAEDARDEAQRTGQARARFLANMSHELRTPMNAVIGYTEIVEEELHDMDIHDLDEELGLVLRSSNELISMISDILDTTMLESGRAEVRLEEVELKAFSEELAKTAEALAKELENCFCFEFSEELDEQMILTDPSKLRQILFNLLSNAAKFTKGGEITMRVQRASQDRIRFEVEDTGIGLAAEERGRVWDDFVQIDDSSTREHGGVGLGLALVKRLAVMLEADVELESVQGEGSTFALMLPVQPQGV